MKLSRAVSRDPVGRPGVRPRAVSRYGGSLRALRGIVGDGHPGGPQPGRGGRELDGNSARCAGDERGPGAVGRSREVARVTPGDVEPADVHRGGAVVGDGVVLRRAGRADLLRSETEGTRAQVGQRARPGEEYLGGGQRLAVRAGAPGRQDLPVTQQGGGVTGADRAHATGRDPDAAGGFVDLCGGRLGACDGRVAAGHQDPAVLQRGGRLCVAFRGHRLGDRPGSRARVIQLGVGQAEGGTPEAALVKPARNQDQPVPQQGGGLLLASGVHRAGLRPGAGGRVVQLGAGRVAAEVVVAGSEPPGDKHLPGAQQRGGVQHPAGVHAARRRPGAGGRVVQLGAGLVGQETARVAAVVTAVTGTAGHEDLPVGQQGGRLTVAGVDHRSGQGPLPGGRVVQFCAGQAAARAGAASSGHQHLTVRQQGGGGFAAGDRHAPGRREGARGRIVKLGGGASAARDEHLAAGQERRGLSRAGDRHRRRRGCPGIRRPGSRGSGRRCGGRCGRRHRGDRGQRQSK